MLVQWKLRFTTYVRFISFHSYRKIPNDLLPLFVSTFRQLPTQFKFMRTLPKIIPLFAGWFEKRLKGGGGFDRKRKQEQRDAIKVVLQLQSILRNEKNYAEQLCWAVKLDTLDDFEYGNDLRRRKSLSSSTTWPFTHAVATLLILRFTRYIMYITFNKRLREEQWAFNEYSKIFNIWCQIIYKQ